MQTGFREMLGLERVSWGDEKNIPRRSEGSQAEGYETNFTV